VFIPLARRNAQPSRPLGSGLWLLVASGLPNGCTLAQNYTDPNGPRYAAEYAATSADPASLPRAKVVTFNIQFSKEYERAAAELLAENELNGVDILLLQEMDERSTDYIARALGHNYVYYPGSVQHGRDFGNAVLSRWPLVADEKLILPHASPADGRIRIAVSATVQTPLGEVQAYSVHLETPWLGPRARMDQAEAVLAHARVWPWPTVIAGDFNTGDPGALDAMVSLYGAERFAWASQSAERGALNTLDLAFAKGFDVLASGALETAASDHEPVWISVRLSEP
jgi:endonuclease/exonuclease/phosphatase family metal-dependent hydrolase